MKFSVCLLPVAGRGVLAVGLVLAAGGILSRDVPVAGLLKLALRRISVLCAKGLPRYWQFKLSQRAPERKEVYLQGGVCTCCGGAPACDVPVAGLLK